MGNIDRFGLCFAANRQVRRGARYIRPRLLRFSSRQLQKRGSTRRYHLFLDVSRPSCEYYPGATPCKAQKLRHCGRLRYRDSLKRTDKEPVSPHRNQSKDIRPFYLGQNAP